MPRYVPRVTSPLSHDALLAEGHRILDSRGAGGSTPKRADLELLSYLPCNLPDPTTDPLHFKSACVLIALGKAEYDVDTNGLVPMGYKLGDEWLALRDQRLR